MHPLGANRAYGYLGASLSVKRRRLVRWVVLGTVAVTVHRQRPTRHGPQFRDRPPRGTSP
jgi:hypothetical protein